MAPTSLLRRRSGHRHRRVLFCAPQPKPEDLGDKVPVMALPDDMLLEVFKRLPPPKDTVRCAAVCRRWRRVISSSASGCLPAPPSHFGFFRNNGPSPLPPFVPTAAGVDLRLGGFLLPTGVSPCGATLVDCRGGLLLLRELGDGGLKTELRLLICNPLARSSMRLPPLPIRGRGVACTALVPAGRGDAAFRVAVVLFGAGGGSFNYYVSVYHSATGGWAAADGTLRHALIPPYGPSVVIGDVAYKVQCDCDQTYIMAVDTTTNKLSIMPLPAAGMVLYSGNHCIGKTADGRLCFFTIREPLLLLTWVLEAPQRWVLQQPPVALRQLTSRSAVGDLRDMRLSAKMSDLLHGYRLVRFGGFCEGTNTLIFIMADRVVALNLTTMEMEKIWRNKDERRPLRDVYPYEMVAWPPVLKDFA